GVPRGIQEKLQANLTILKLDHKWKVQSSKFKSKSRNTPFEGWPLHGAPMITIYKGKIVWKHASL
ncbi:MAG TPA: dihydroorotase, partial [Acidobacteriota bacterium]|nr:dihydroorotase [Acidobacteriota bacterium]